MSSLRLSAVFVGEDQCIFDDVAQIFVDVSRKFYFFDWKLLSDVSNTILTYSADKKNASSLNQYHDMRRNAHPRDVFKHDVPVLSVETLTKG